MFFQAATLPSSSTSFYKKLKPNTTSASSSTAKLKNNKKCSLGNNQTPQQHCDIDYGSSNSSNDSCNISNRHDERNIAKDFSSEPFPHTLVFNSYKNDKLPISNNFATEYNRDNKSISKTTKAMIDEVR